MMDRIILEDLNKIKSDIKGDFLAGKNTLVTGGAGFIGSWLCDVLISLDANVIALDDFSTGRRRNIDHLTKNPKFKLVECDVCAYKAETKFDLIFHLAGHASPEEYQTHPIATLQTSSFGTLNMAELARKNDAILLFASTSEVYGDAEVIPTPESYWGKVNPIGPRSCYDEGKRFAEALLVAYCRQYGLDTRIPRIFNSYGPRLREDGIYGRAMSRFINQALTKNPITIYGDGTQTRSFCYITDTITGLLSLTTNQNAKGETVNIGNSQEVKILDLANRIAKLTNFEGDFKFYSFPKDDPKRRCPNISKMEKLTGWTPKVNLDEGLKRITKWFSVRSNKTK